MSVQLNGSELTLDDVVSVAKGRGGEVGLTSKAETAVQKGRTYVEDAVASGKPVYGVTTGFGRLAEMQIAPSEQRRLQLNLVRSHASGVGPALPDEVVRATMLLRANALARGHSGCRVAVVRRLTDLLNFGVHPRVPEIGSVGASGDLAPLAHIALVLIGEGSVQENGQTRPASEVLAVHGLEPLVLEAKEGLALINGTQAMTGMGILALHAVKQSIEAAEVAGAMTLDALRGTPEPFRAEVHEVRAHSGQAASGRRLIELLQGSEIRESHRTDDSRVQDAYSLRCMPQVHGAARQAMEYVSGILLTEANSVTDNPLIFADAGAVVSAGNFHGQIVAQALDLLCIAAADLASMSERRVERLLNPDLSGLPPFLANEPGLESGYMIGQVTVVDMLGEMRVLATPVSVDSAPTSANQEDHVSMGFAAARKARRVAELLRWVVGVELLIAARALEFQRPLRSGAGVEEAHRRIRERVPSRVEDRSLSGEIESVAALIESGSFAPHVIDEASTS